MSAEEKLKEIALIIEGKDGADKIFPNVKPEELQAIRILKIYKLATGKDLTIGIMNKTN